MKDKKTAVEEFIAEAKSVSPSASKFWEIGIRGGWRTALEKAFARIHLEAKTVEDAERILRELIDIDSGGYDENKTRVS